MPGFNTLPAVGGGGGQPNMTFIGSVHMETYNRSWTQGGTAGYYALYSTNQENGYAYFVGATTTGVALNRLANISHSFTRIDIIAPSNDMISLYKAKVKSTTIFNNPFSAFSGFPSIITSSGNFVLPNNALPLVNAIVGGGGGASGAGHGDGHGGGGGGGGGNIVKLTAFQAVGTTAVTIGAGGTRPYNYSSNSHMGGPGNRTYFGNVYANGGGGGGGWSNRTGGGTQNGWGGGGNGGGGGGGSGAGSGGTAGSAQTPSTGLGFAGTPEFFGSHNGGGGHNSNSHHSRGGGGGGALGAGEAGGHGGGGSGASGHQSDITGVNAYFGSGGAGDSPNHGAGHHTGGYAAGGTGSDNGHPGSSVHGTGGATGLVVVRYYIP